MLHPKCLIQQPVDVVAAYLEDYVLQEAVRLRDAFKAMTGGRQGAFTTEGVIDV